MIEVLTKLYRFEIKMIFMFATMTTKLNTIIPVSQNSPLKPLKIYKNNTA